MLLGKDEGQNIIVQVLAQCRADEVTVTLEASSTAHLRYALNTPSTSGQHTDHVLSVKSTFGKRSASATVNQLDARTLAEVVQRSEQLARLAPEDPEHVTELGPQEYPDVQAYDERLLESGAADMVRGTALCIGQARSVGLSAAGYSEASATASWIGNRRGLRGYHRRTDVSFSQTARTGPAGALGAVGNAPGAAGNAPGAASNAPGAAGSAPDGSGRLPAAGSVPGGSGRALPSAAGGGSGWAADVGNSVGSLDYSRCSRTAIAKAQASVASRPLAPGKYVTILEPSCVASLVQMLAFSLNQRSAEEGRSFFAEPAGKTKLGQQLFPKSVSLRSDPRAAAAPGTAWGEEALPQRPRTWIEQGRLENLYCERFWAEQRQREPVPPPSNLLMAGGSGSIDDLIADTPRGVLITSFFYIRFVDPRTLLLTGLTRDGVFWIENGKISHPVTNFRWNESPIRVLQNVEALSASVRAAPREGMDTTLMMPALRVKEFELSSVSDAV
jgi:predicted Zn-dependent protease